MHLLQKGTGLWSILVAPCSVLKKAYQHVTECHARVTDEFHNILSFIHGKNKAIAPPMAAETKQTRGRGNKSSTSLQRGLLLTPRQSFYIVFPFVLTTYLSKPPPTFIVAVSAQSCRYPCTTVLVQMTVSQAATT